MCVSSGRVFVRRTNCADVSDRLCLQVVYIQDFPRKDRKNSGAGNMNATSQFPPPDLSSDFEDQLTFAMKALQVPSGKSRRSLKPLTTVLIFTPSPTLNRASSLGWSSALRSLSHHRPTCRFRANTTRHWLGQNREIRSRSAWQADRGSVA